MNPKKTFRVYHFSKRVEPNKLFIFDLTVNDYIEYLKLAQHD